MVGWIIERMSEDVRRWSETAGERPAPLTVDEITEFWSRLAGALDKVDDTEAIRQIGALERLKGAASAVQARHAVELLRSQASRDAGRDIAAEQSVRSVGAEIGLARKESPCRGARFLRLARLLTAQMPATMGALSIGAISEYRAALVVGETVLLSAADRARLDSEIGGLLGGLSDRQARATAARIAYRLDPQAAVDRTHAAESARRVTFRPAPDTMAIMAALVPARDGVAMFAALDRAAKTAKAAGDHRTRGQIMADTLLARVTGTESVEDLPIEIRLVITDDTLFAGGSTPARMEGYDGPIPAPTARRLALGDDTTTAKRRLRRVYTRDETIIGMDHRARHFTGNLRDLLILRDQHCRTPYCDAPIRHIDHIVPHHDNGPTSTGNGQGLCAGCNYLKEHPDWTTTVSNNDEPGRPHTTHITTPTGHHHHSTAPPPLGIGARRKAETAQ